MPLGLTSFLPNDHEGATDATGQRDWRFCANATACSGPRTVGRWGRARPVKTMLRSAGFSSAFHGRRARAMSRSRPARSARSAGLRFRGVCRRVVLGWRFLQGSMPSSHGRADLPREPLWDHDGVPTLRLEPPYGITESLVVPSGAFSYGGRVYVFVNISARRCSGVKRPTEPDYGLYLTSNHSRTGPAATRLRFGLPILGSAIVRRTGAERLRKPWGPRRSLRDAP